VYANSGFRAKNMNGLLLLSGTITNRRCTVADPTIQRCQVLVCTQNGVEMDTKIWIQYRVD
jgi:hypothetical protein